MHKTCYHEIHKRSASFQQTSLKNHELAGGWNA